MRVFALIFAAAFLLAADVAAASPAMIDRGEPALEGAERSFDRFAEGWISKAIARGERASDAPRARQGASGLVFTYQTVSDAFETELRPTGRAGAPYVGVLTYTEQTFTCADVRGEDCRVTSSLETTEVFRFRDGRWTY